MKNITLITSVVDTPNKPLSYTSCRSVFTKEERFEQTKNTIASIREKIPNNKIILIECSPLSDSEREYFIENTDFFLNIYDTNKQELIQRMFTISKSMGEGTMTVIALQYLFNNNIEFDNLFKISGRYWLNDGFKYELYDNNLTCIHCIHCIHNDRNNVFTCFYKLSKNVANQWLDYLINSENDFMNCIGFEIIFANFLKFVDFDIVFIENKVGINGYVTVCGSFIDM